MAEPNFLLIGAPKSGTTSVYHWLKQHPDIFMAEPKEPNFFCFHDNLPVSYWRWHAKQNSFSSYDEYLGLYRNASASQVIGEASTRYLWFPGTASNIAGFLPDVKIIAIFRQPADRSFSHFMMRLRDGYETQSDFGDLIKKMDFTDTTSISYQQYILPSLYGHHIQTYFDSFPAKNIKTFIFDDFAKHSLQIIQDIYHFIGVNANFKIS